MRNLRFLMFLTGVTLVSACSSPVVMQTDFQSKMITRCDNDIFCFRKSYDVAWDRSGYAAHNYYVSDANYRKEHYADGIPVSYRSNEFIYAGDPRGYIVTLPSGGNFSIPK